MKMICGKTVEHKMNYCHFKMRTKNKKKKKEIDNKKYNQSIKFNSMNKLLNQWNIGLGTIVLVKNLKSFKMALTNLIVIQTVKLNKLLIKRSISMKHIKNNFWMNSKKYNLSIYNLFELPFFLIIKNLAAIITNKLEQNVIKMR